MAHTAATYVIFDGDKDMWAYRYMKGWRINKRVDFDFRDAHDLRPLTARAQDEAYVKRALHERMKGAQQALVLIGESTKYLYRFVRWEIELAIEKDLPLVGVNLNHSRRIDDKCPPSLRDHCAIFVPFRARIIRYALDNWPSEYRKRQRSGEANGALQYVDRVYSNLGLNAA